MFESSSSGESNDQDKWVDNLLAAIQETRDDEDHEDSRSITSDAEQLQDNLLKHLEDLQRESPSNNNQDTTRTTPGPNAIQNETGIPPDSKLEELQERLKQGQEYMDSRYKKIKELFQRLVTLNKAQQEERAENLEVLDSLKSDVRRLKIRNKLKRTEILEAVGERYLEKRDIRFQNGIPPNFVEADVLLDSQIVQNLRKNDKFREPHAALGFHAIYALRQSEYGQHLQYAPQAIIDIVDFRAELSHLACYKNVVGKEKLSAMKVKCYGIISLWKEHVDPIKGYPADEEEAEARQLENYPAEQIEAEIDEFYEMYNSWEEKEATIRSIRSNLSRLLDYHHISGDEEKEFTLRKGYTFAAILTSILCVLFWYNG